MSRYPAPPTALVLLLGLNVLTACGGGADSVDSAPRAAAASTGGAETGGEPAPVAGPALPDADPDPVAGGDAPPRIDGSPAASVMDDVALALASGDASVVDDVGELEDALIASIDDAAALHREALVRLFELSPDGTPKADGSSLTSIDWNPTHDAALLAAEPGENVALLTTNAVANEGYAVQRRTLAVLGESRARYIVMGGNPMRNHRRDASSLDEQMHRLLENGIDWLVDGDESEAAPLRVTMAHLEQSHYFPDELGVREWLDERLAGQVIYNDRDACDDDALAACLAGGTDLLIVSGHQRAPGTERTVAAAIDVATGRGVPVLYLHLDGGRSALSDALLRLFDVRHDGDNYWRKLSLSAYDPSARLGEPSVGLAAVRRLATNFRERGFAIDWNDCDGEDCSANASLDTEFWEGTRYAKSLLRALDENKTDLFAHPGRYRFKKLLALLGDRYRTEVRFPMDRETTPETEFLRALYADHSTYQYRERVGVWSDLGNFGRADYSHVVPTRRTVRHVSKRHFRSTGAYALPGRTVTVTRNDDSAVGVGIRVNSLRDGSTHVYAESGYKRPHALWNRSIAIEPGETIRFTSPIGGPVQLEYDTDGLPVEIVFDGVGEHAYRRDAADDASFAAKLYANELDWAEIATPSFEVHSTRDRMVESMADPMFGVDGGTPGKLAAAVMRYVHDLPHVLAGFRGPGVTVVDEIHRFAADNGLPVASLDLVKHMNADQASCGYGCSGNPYDAYWSFSPIGHGDLHELGHGLERPRFRFTGWPGHATTNFYSYYAKSRYFDDTGEEPNCQSLPFRSNFDVLRRSLAEADPGAYVRANLWSEPSWAEGAAMIIQMMMAAEDAGALDDGWHLLARLHVVEREYRKALQSEAAWLATRDGLGLSLYGRDEARALGAEDWLLIAVSHASGLDHRAYFDVWGHRYGDGAAAQVATMALPSMPLNYYVSSGDGFCRGEGFDGRKIALDGVADWPDGG